MVNYKVLIVEDDFMVADINKSVTEEVEGFEVVKIAKTAGDALSFIKKAGPDLAIVDIYLPDFSGIELIKKIRKNDYPVDVILLTAAHDSDTVENSMRYGAFDYIIKPYAFSRFKEALENYKIYKLNINSSKEYNQEKINNLIAHNSLSSGRGNLPKGITLYTLEIIKTAVSECLTSFTIEDVIDKTKLSKITARRYLEYLTDAGFIRKTYEHKKTGRPAVIYTKISV